MLIGAAMPCYVAILIGAFIYYYADDSSIAGEYTKLLPDPLISKNHQTYKNILPKTEVHHKGYLAPERGFFNLDSSLIVRFHPLLVFEEIFLHARQQRGNCRAELSCHTDLLFVRSLLSCR